MISRADKKKFLKKEPQFDDIMLSLLATQKQPRAIVKEAREVVALARKFNEEVVRPAALDLDARMHADPAYLPWDFVKTANRWGMYTLFLPKILGGRGANLSCAGYFLEELGSQCLAMANLVGVHYLGYVMLIASWNMDLMGKISKEVVQGEKDDDPCLISLAMTEPDAGTDSQNIEVMDYGNLACHATREAGGYRLNGTKIFISCGHFSKWHLVHAYTDLNKASENTVMLAVRADAPGFSVGKMEKKMGQKGCPASELIFNNCFVPNEYVCIDNDQMKNRSKGIKQTNEQIFAYIWAASRMGVGAFGTGAARGAFETALDFASETEINGRRLVDQEWCQSMLAQMYQNVAMGRLAYVEAAYANGMHGIWKVMNQKPMYYLARYTPRSLLTKIINPFLSMPIMTWLFRFLCFDLQKPEEIDCTDGWGSLAKVVGTDIGVRNGRMALEIMGQAGIRQDQRAEKILRDAKLLQIYEGTNQINRINIFKRLIGRGKAKAKVFSPSNV